MFFYLIAPLGRKSPALTYKSHYLLHKGDLIQIEIRSKHTKGVVLSKVDNPDFKCKETIPCGEVFSQNQQILAEFIASYYRCLLSESYGLFKSHLKTNPPKAYLPAPSMQHTHFIRFFEQKPLRILDSNQKQAISQNLKPLSQAQQSAFDFLDSRNIGLLFGDTGSGKSEIYFHHIAKVLEQNKSALFLMPEISLTPQMKARLEAVFGECVGIWHSKLTKAQKDKLLEQLRMQKIKIIAGARSALFLPLANLGLIIVDEEHDEAYKAMSAPRYNARDISLFLAQKARIKVILGSATPSLNSYMLAKQKGYLFRLKGQFFDSKKDFILESSKTELTPKLIDSIHQTLEHKKQTIIFLPTRANFNSLLCLECGYGFICPFCSVNMSVHSKQNALICHYCSYTAPIPKQCPQCQNTELSSQRIGTAQIATELQEIFTNARIGVFDRDHITTHNKLKTTLSDFNNGKIDILIGTQMLSKGHDYHNVALAVVLGIDYVLHSGDFKSFERGVALLHQIAGRAGRREQGRVFIQSLQLQWCSQFLDDYEDFLCWELAHRSKSYPPFSRLAMLHFANKDHSKANRAMLEILDQIKNAKNITIIGYGKNAIEKIANKWRFHILISAQKTSQILYALDGLEVDVDIDAIQTL